MNAMADDDKTIRIDKDTHRKLKVDSALQDKTIKEYLRELIFGKNTEENEEEKTGKGK